MSLSSVDGWCYLSMIVESPQFMLKYRGMLNRLKSMGDKNDNQKLNWNICGHGNIVHFLQSAILNDGVAHAYLFVGPAHLGKQTLAREFISSLLCSCGNEPCGQCADCTQLKNSIHPDLYNIKKEVNEKTGKLRREIVIDQIRDLKQKMQQGTLLGGYKIALIEDAHLMNKNTANSLLKLLEEPTAKTVLILIADNLTSLPQTIPSRCQTLNFLPVAIGDIESYLGGKTIDAKVFAKQSHGCPGVAINLLGSEEDHFSLNDNICGFFQVMESGLGDKFAMVDTLVDWDKDEAINVSRLGGLLSNWQSVIRDILLIKNNNEEFVSNINHMAKLREHAVSSEFSRLKSILLRIDLAKEYLWHNINSKSSLENLIINL